MSAGNATSGDGGVSASVDLSSKASSSASAENSQYTGGKTINFAAPQYRENNSQNLYYIVGAIIAVLVFMRGK